jgi:hypothetical protein
MACKSAGGQRTVHRDRQRLPGAVIENASQLGRVTRRPLA